MLQFIVVFAFDQIGRNSILNKFFWKEYFEKTYQQSKNAFGPNPSILKNSTFAN